jgi:hypothetical protein
MVHHIRGQKGKKKGGGGEFSNHGTFSPAALLFPPLSPSSAHHSAANAVSERNPPTENHENTPSAATKKTIET